jgi:O-antigen ligase
MATTAKKLSFESLFIFLFLVLFPFGQIIRIGIVQPIDLVVGAAALYSIIKNLKKPKILRYLNLFLIFAFASWLFSSFTFKSIEIFYGFLYLIRLVAYIYFLVYAWNFAQKEEDKELLLDSLLAVSLISAFFGWIQFFWFADIKPFFVWGWDMHLFRLVGTFLDPTFLGIIIVFGLVISINRFIDNKNWKMALLVVFLVFSLAFTYSRASYLAFFAALLVIAFYRHLIKPIIVGILAFCLVIFLLPTAKNHSIELFRTFSAEARITDYKNTLLIFSKSPIFGVGYNNLCIAYQKYIGIQSFSSHACSGSDSSLLYILATTGIVGFVIFIFGIIRGARFLEHSLTTQIFVANFAALLTHSFFSNSLVYPWVLGYLMILLALSVKERSLE